MASLYAADSDRGTAAPPQTIRRSDDRSNSRRSGSAPIQIVGTPAVVVTRWRSIIPRIARGVVFGPGSTWLAPAISAQ
jgi:hypothetical protein